MSMYWNEHTYTSSTSKIHPAGVLPATSLVRLSTLPSSLLTDSQHPVRRVSDAHVALAELPAPGMLVSVLGFGYAPVRGWWSPPAAPPTLLVNTTARHLSDELAQEVEQVFSAALQTLWSHRRSFKPTSQVLPTWLFTCVGVLTLAIVASMGVAGMIQGSGGLMAGSIVLLITMAVVFYVIILPLSPWGRGPGVDFLESIIFEMEPAVKQILAAQNLRCRLVLSRETSLFTHGLYSSPASPWELPRRNGVFFIRLEIVNSAAGWTLESAADAAADHAKDLPLVSTAVLRSYSALAGTEQGDNLINQAIDDIVTTYEAAEMLCGSGQQQTTVVVVEPLAGLPQNEN